MASKITNSIYLQIELADASGEFTRVYRVENPRSTITTKAQVATILAPAFAEASDGSTFFQDDATDAWLKQVKTVTKVEVKKTETPFE